MQPRVHCPTAGPFLGRAEGRQIKHNSSVVLSPGSVGILVGLSVFMSNDMLVSIANGSKLAYVWM